MWEAKLNASRALQSAEDSSNANSNGNAVNRLPTTGHHKESNVKSEIVSSKLLTNPNTPGHYNKIFLNKNFKDSATRSALNALPQSFHSGASSSHQNGKKLHTPQLDGNADDLCVVKPKNKCSISLTKEMLKKMKNNSEEVIIQVDGGGDDSDVDDDDDDDIGEVSIHGDEDDDDADDDKAGNEGNSEYEGKEDPDPLNSDDDLTEPGSPDSNSDLFDTDNVIVCQYDKVSFFTLTI